MDGEKKKKVVASGCQVVCVGDEVAMLATTSGCSSGCGRVNCLTKI